MNPPVGLSKQSGARTPVVITLNGERREFAGSLTVSELLADLKVRPEHVAVEVNRDLVTRARHAETRVNDGDVLEVVTLVGGGSEAAVEVAPEPEPLTIG